MMNYYPHPQPTSGWNDPPPIAAKQNPVCPTPALQVQWKPIEKSPPSAMGLPAVIRPIATYGQPSNVGTSQQRVFTGQSNKQPAQAYEEPKFKLASDDQQLVDSIIQIADGVLAMNRVPAVSDRVEELKKRLNKEIGERLAYRKLGEITKKLLRDCGEAAARGDFQGAKQIVHQMVTSGQDFVEISTFVPSLKTLLSQATACFQQNKY